ncbi:MAG: hypothetical protein GX616_11200, partial [Planctomycetes bacterium]|nr:hypothetical protein [Planctomycetota bacterium]
MRVTGVYSKRDIVTTRAHAREGFTRLAAAGLLLTITSIGCSNVKKPGPTVPTGTPVPAVFVSPEGKLGWSGTLVQPNADKTDGPLPTLQAARDAIRARRAKGELTGEVAVVVTPGTYYLEEPLTFEPEDSNVFYSSLSNLAEERATISGGRRITGWKTAEVNGKKVWAAELADVKSGRWYPRQLFVNNERRPRTRLPKEGYFELAGLPQMDDKTPWNKGQTEATFKSGDIKNWRNLGDVEIVALHFWIESRLPLAEVNESENLAK